jgi:branched-chain amino acid transport system ATP-binding protein
VTALLSVAGLTAAYGPVQVLHGIDFHVNEGEAVVVLGANGAGKTTTIRSVCQMVSTKGGITFDGEQLVGRSTTDIARMGVSHVPQGRGTFPDLTVEENLEVGAFRRKTSAPTTTCGSPFSPVSASADASWPAASPAASSRCSPWPAP